MSALATLERKGLSCDLIVLAVAFLVLGPSHRNVIVAGKQREITRAVDISRREYCSAHVG